MRANATPYPSTNYWITGSWC